MARTKSVKTQTAETNYNKAIDKYQATADSAPQYSESRRTQQAYNQWTNYEKNNKPGEYQGSWVDTLNNKVNSYLNQDPYSYKSQNDANYQAARNEYINNGQKAMKDTMTQASALTGGYGNTYAQSVGQQQYNSQMDNLSQKAVEYEQQAYNRYLGDREQQLNAINTLQNLDNTEYSRYRDSVNDYNTFLNYLQNKYATLQNVDNQTFQNEFNVWQQQLGAQGTLLSTAQNQYQYLDTMDENKYQYDTTFSENKRQFDKTFSEDKRQFDKTFSEDKRQFDKTFSEDKRQFDTSFGETKRQFNDTMAEDKRQFNTTIAHSSTKGSSVRSTSGSTSGSTSYSTAEMRKMAVSDPDTLRSYLVNNKGYSTPNANKIINKYAQEAGSTASKNQTYNYDDAYKLIKSEINSDKRLRGTSSERKVNRETTIKNAIQKLYNNGQITMDIATKLKKAFQKYF